MNDFKKKINKVFVGNPDFKFKGKLKKGKKKKFTDSLPTIEL